MRKIIAYIAQSADGKIARPDGRVDWLENIPNPGKTDYGYARFYDSVDTTIMGFATYRQILDFNIPFPYPDKKNFVLTEQEHSGPHPHVSFQKPDVSFFKSLKESNGKDIWLVGGAKTNSWFLQNRLIDEMYLFMMPVILGSGIPLFDPIETQHGLTLTSSEPYASGAVLLKYLFEAGSS